MKKLFLGIVSIFFMVGVNAQTFGLKAGVDFATAKAKFEGLTVSSDETGFYIGAFTDLNVSESFDVRAEVNYVSIEDLDQIQIPVLANFSIAEGFGLLVGPSFGFLLDSEEGIKSFNFGVDFGLSYDITEKFLIEARYDLGLSNLAEDNEFDASLKLSGIQVGIGYRF